MIRRIAVSVIAFLLWLSMPAFSAPGGETRALLEFMRTIAKTYMEGNDVTDRIFGIEDRVHDYFYGDLTEDGFRREVTDELFQSEKEVEAFREKLAQLPPVPKLSNSFHAEIAQAHVDALYTRTDEMRLLLDNTRELMNAALEDDTERFDRAAARSLRIEVQGTKNVNQTLRLTLEGIAETHPEHSLIGSVIATNRAHGLFLGTMAEMYGKSYQGFAPVSEEVIAALEESRLAVSRGRENIINIVEPFRDAVVIDVVVEGWELTPEEKEQEALVQRIGESFYRSFQIQEKLIDTLREFHDFYLRVSADDLPVATIEYQETHESLYSTIYDLSDQRADVGEERSRLMLTFIDLVYSSN